METAEPAFFLNLGMGRIPVFNMGAIRKKQRALKGAESRASNKAAAAAWAAAERPYSLSDLALAAFGSPAWNYFHGLSLADTKLECAAHGLPITGAKYKLFDSLVKHAAAVQHGNPQRGEFGAGATAPPALKATDAGKVRRALVADLRKGLVFVVS